MSYLFKIYSPVIFEENATYVMGLTAFMTFNIIPNIDKINKFYIGHYELGLSEGTYDITDEDGDLINFKEELITIHFT